jgi:hypothetical protein
MIMNASDEQLRAMARFFRLLAAPFGSIFFLFEQRASRLEDELQRRARIESDWQRRVAVNRAYLTAGRSHELS